MGNVQEMAMVMAMVLVRCAASAHGQGSYYQSLQYGTRSTFDLAYGEYKPPLIGKKFTLQAGKVILSFHRPGATELLWDTDLRPVGFAVFVPNRIGSLRLRRSASRIF